MKVNVFPDLLTKKAHEVVVGAIPQERRLGAEDAGTAPDLTEDGEETRDIQMVVFYDTLLT